MGEKKILLPLIEAIEALNVELNWDPSKRGGKNVVAIGTIYNLFNKKKLTRHGGPRNAQVDLSELVRKFGGKQKSK